MKISEIRSKDTSALVEELRTLEMNRLDVSLRAVTEEGEGRKLRPLRRDIARYQTILGERGRVEKGGK